MNEKPVDDVGVYQTRVRITPDGRLTRRDAAAYLGMAEKTLAQWSSEGRGPQMCRVGGRVFYFKDALDAFIRGETLLGKAAINRCPDESQLPQ